MGRRSRPKRLPRRAALAPPSRHELTVRGAGGPLRNPAGQRGRGLPQLPRLPRAGPAARDGLLLARRGLFAHTTEASELDHLRELRTAGRLPRAARPRQVAPGIELIQVGGHSPGQAIVTVATASGPVVLASDAVHYYEELERDRPFSIVASLGDMYAAFDQIRELAQAGARVVAGHDPLVAERFGSLTDPPDVITIQG